MSFAGAAEDADYDDVSPERAAANAAVTAATAPSDKVNALFHRAVLILKDDGRSDDDLAQAQRDLDATIDLMLKAEARTGESIAFGARLYFQKGYACWLEGNYPAALAAYDLADARHYTDLAKDTKSHGAELYENRAAIKRVLWNYRGAVADYSAALALRVNSDDLRERADLYFELGDAESANADWARVVELEKLDPKTTRNPFDMDFLPLNKAVWDNPRNAAPLIARARLTYRRSFLANIAYVYEKRHGSVVAVMSQKLEPALADLDRAVKVAPDDPKAWMERGRMRLVYIITNPWNYARAFDYSTIHGDFDHVLEIDPRNAEAWYEDGIARLALWEGQEHSISALTADRERTQQERTLAAEVAIRCFSRAIYLQPNASGDAHYRRTEAERMLPHPDTHALLVDSLAAIDQNLSPTDPEWDSQLRCDPETKPGPVDALGLYISKVDYNKPNRDALADAHALAARILLSLGRNNEALPHLDAAIAACSDDFSLRFDRGRLRTQRGDYAGAALDLGLVVAAHPEVPQGWLMLAVAEDGAGDTTAAAADLKEAISRDPSIADRLEGSRYGKLHVDPAQGIAPRPSKADRTPKSDGTPLDHKNAGNELRPTDFAGALHEYNVALMLDPDYADALSNRGGIYLDRGQIDLALADFTHAIAVNPKHFDAYANRADLHDKLNEETLAIEDFTHALENAPDDAGRAGMLHKRALAQEDLDFAAAIADAKAACALAPQAPEIWKTLGRLQLNNNLHADAVASYRQVKALQPLDIRNRALLCVALAIVGDDAAQAELDEALAMADAEGKQTLWQVVGRARDVFPDAALLRSLAARAKAAIVEP